MTDEILKGIEEELAKDNVNHLELCRKYIALGRKLEREQLVRSMRNDFYATLAEVDKAAMEVEAYEAQKMKELEALKKDGPIKAQMVTIFQSLNDEVNSKHTTIVKELRNPKFKTIFENYLPILADEK